MQVFSYLTLFIHSISICFLMQTVVCIDTLNDIYGKVVGGKTTNIKKFPFAVRFFNTNLICSGTILNSWTVMTAAHCVNVNKNVNGMILGVGSSYLQDYNSTMYDVSSFVIHEDYNKDMPFAADIALLFVKRPIKFSENVKKAILCNNMEWKTGKKDIVVIGWGKTKQSGPYELETGLMQTTLRYVRKETCEKNHNMKFTEEMFCLYGDGEKDTCQGDSGGGVLWKGRVIGIVSHGHGCALKGKPSVYISVWHYRKWIEEQIGEFIKRFCKPKKKKKIKTTT